MKISEYTRATEPLTGDEVLVLNQNQVTHNTTVSAIVTSTVVSGLLSLKEDLLGVPDEDGYFLASTISGERYWVPLDGFNSEHSEIYNYTGNIDLYDFVTQSGVSKYVNKVANNLTTNPVIGIVTDLVSLSEVEVTSLGYFNFNSDVFIEGKKIFISENGDLTTMLPSKGYVQVLGYAVTARRMYLNPDPVRISRIN